MLVDKKGRHSKRGTTEDLEQDLGLKLMECWGRPSPRLIHLLELMTKLKARKSRTSSAVRSPAIQKQTRLSEAQVKKLIADYQKGSSVSELAKQYKIHRTTVMDHLKRADVPRRPHLRKMTDEQVQEAVRLRAKGASFAELGRRYGVDPSTISNVLP